MRLGWEFKSIPNAPQAQGEKEFFILYCRAEGTGLLSSYTWSGGAMKKMKDAVEKLKWELIEPVIEVKSAAKEADFLECDRLALAIHNKLEKFPVNKPSCEC